MPHYLGLDRCRTGELCLNDVMGADSLYRRCLLYVFVSESTEKDVNRLVSESFVFP